MLSGINARVRKFKDHSRLPAWKLSGSEKHSGEPLDILYAGPPSQLAFIKGRFYSDSAPDQALGTSFSWSLNKAGARNGCQLVIAVQSITALNLLPRTGYVLPLWVEALANTTESPYDTKDHSMKKDIKQLTKNDLVCEMARSREDYDFFWQRMYIPYAHAQYGDAVILETEDNFFEQVDEGSLELFFSCRDGRRLAGGGLSVTDTTPRYRYLGVLDGDNAHRNIGAAAAAYIFMLDWAHKNGFEQVNMGGCRPFLNDGVLQYKKKFNITLDNANFARVLYMNPIMATDGAVSCLLSNPIIRIDGNALCATIFEHEDHDTRIADSVWQYSKKIIGGLDRVERKTLA